MEYSDIQHGLNGFVERYDSQTYIGSYRDTTRDSLLKDGLTTRANSLWKMAEYVVAKYDSKPNEPIANYLRGWKELASRIGNQYLLIELSDNTWEMYDSNGKRLGGEDYISEYFNRKKQERKINGKSSTPQQTNDGFSRQIIFYGAPGTGKSHEVKRITGECDDEERANVFRTTFHPDTDYASFVGCYKPTMVDVPEKYKAVAGKDCEISYEFVPQTFTDAYVYAYQHPDTPTYLVIEEINRGNCAQVFGDLFQLLDRKEDGTSEYSIKADTDLAKHLIKEGVASGEPEKVKLCLPANLHILATMNTSDQSLFPMDSAFKRRWDWEYVPISYTEEKSGAFEIEIGGEKYKWVKFIEAVNKRIFDLTQSEDKEMGNFFVKNSVDERQFKSKVMFYLWNEVLRDEVENQKYFFYAKDEDGTKRKFTFKDLYEENATETLKGFMRFILT